MNKVHDVKQLQNKYNLLKKDWQSWLRLMDTRHGPTGISYNEAIDLLQASDELWTKYEKNAIKFKTKLLEHLDLMVRVYKGAIVTGKYAWTPDAAFELATEDEPLPMNEEDYEDNSVVCPLSSLPSRVNTLSSTLPSQWCRHMCLYALHRRQFTLMTHLRVVGANANSVTQHTGSEKKAKVRECRSW